MSDSFLMDRETTVSIFRGMIEQKSSEHVFRIIGLEKMGKSRVLREFYNISKYEYHAFSALVDLRSKLQNFADLLFVICEQLGSDHFINFHNIHNDIIAQRKGVEISRTTLIFSTLKVDDKNNKLQDDILRRQLTNAFLKDISSFPFSVPLVFLFDAFEQADESIQDWINEQLLVGLCQLSNVYVVIAGRQLPEPPISYFHSCKFHELIAVEFEAHKKYCVQVGIDIDEQIINAFYTAFEGRPGLFVEYASKLLRN